MQQKILVTGADGFLGHHLMAVLKNEDTEAYAGDIRQMEHYNSAADIVCHLAAKTKATGPDELETLFDVNVSGTLSVMRYCYRHRARCVLISSSAVYAPSNEEILLSETAPLLSTSRAKGAYGTTKMLSEKVSEYYSTYFNIPVTVLRVFNLYGEGQKDSFLIPSLIQAVREKKSLTLNTPFFVRDFIHVQDVVSAILFSLTDGHSGWRCFNIGTGRGLSILQVLHEILEFHGMTLSDSQINISNNPEKNFVIADIQKFTKTFPWKSKISLEEGIRSLYK